MRDDDLRGAAVPHTADGIGDLARMGEVKAARGLVVDDEGAVGGKRLGDRDALALSARQREGVLCRELVEVEVLQDVKCALFAVIARHAEQHFVEHAFCE